MSTEGLDQPKLIQRGWAEIVDDPADLLDEAGDLLPARRHHPIGGSDVASLKRDRGDLQPQTDAGQ